MAQILEEILADSLLARLQREVEGAGRLRAISVDLTHVCNLRCEGCYFFAEEMDRHESPDEDAFDAFVEREKARGTNFITVLGGEPALALGRLKKLHDHFRLVVPTNGTKRIPFEGFERLAVAPTVWGDHAADTAWRGGGKQDVFAKALKHYRDDPRVFWYFVTSAGNADQIAPVAEECVANGNFVHFTFYGDLARRGGSMDHGVGFAAVCREIDRAIERYPSRILVSSYLARVVATGKLFDEVWGHDVCTSCSIDDPRNSARFANGKPYNRHFNAYNADLRSVRRCCVGEERDCSTCFDVWSHYSWIMLNRQKHMGSKQDFSNWLINTYLFYLTNRLVDGSTGAKLLPEIHERQRYLRADAMTAS